MIIIKIICIYLIFKKNKRDDNLLYLVKTKHRSVAERIINCWERADWDFCMARWRSFCKYSARLIHKTMQAHLIHAA